MLSSSKLLYLLQQGAQSTKVMDQHFDTQSVSGQMFFGKSVVKFRF